jgi:opacity protein-like surface antigen
MPRALRSMLCAASLMTLCFATPAAAESGPDYSRPGWYVGLGGFFAISDFERDTSDLDVVPEAGPPNTDPKFGNSGGIDVRGGYRAFERWAFEFDYQWQSGFNSTSGSLINDVEIDTHLVSLNTKFYVLTGRIQPYALLGASVMIFNTEIVDDDFKKPWDVTAGFAPRFGLGIDYYLTPHWTLGLEGTYIVPVGVLDGSNMGSVGVGATYRF